MTALRRVSGGVRRVLEQAPGRLEAPRRVSTAGRRDSAGEPWVLERPSSVPGAVFRVALRRRRSVGGVPGEVFRGGLCGV